MILRNQYKVRQNFPISWEEIEKATKATFLAHESLKKGIPIYF